MSRDEIYQTVKLLTNAFDKSSDDPVPYDENDSFQKAFWQTYCWHTEIGYPLNTNMTEENRNRFKLSAWKFYYENVYLNLWPTYRPQIYISPSGPYRGTIGVSLDMTFMRQATRTQSGMVYSQTVNDFFEKWGEKDKIDLPKFKYQTAKRNPKRRSLTPESVQTLKLWKNGVLGVAMDWMDENGVEYEVERKKTDNYVIHIFHKE